jgi:SRSO17 transposase
MDTVEVQQLADDLDAFVADVFASLTRSGWQDRAEYYLRGLMLDGRRKSIQPMAARLAGPHEQALNHFVTNSPWDVARVRRRLAERMDEAIGPQAWALDDTGWLKCGAASVCVARQYTAAGVRQDAERVVPRLAEAGMTAPVMRERDGELGG